MPEEISGSTAALLDGHAEEVTKGLVLGRLSKLDESSWGNEPKSLWRGERETTGLVIGFPFESEKLC